MKVGGLFREVTGLCALVASLNGCGVHYVKENVNVPQIFYYKMPEDIKENSRKIRTETHDVDIWQVYKKWEEYNDLFKDYLDKAIEDKFLTWLGTNNIDFGVIKEKRLQIGENTPQDDESGENIEMRAKGSIDIDLWNLKEPSKEPKK